MKKSILVCLVIAGAAFANACNENTIDFGCSKDDNYCAKEDNKDVCYICTQIKDGSFWSKEVCEFGGVIESFDANGAKTETPVDSIEKANACRTINCVNGVDDTGKCKCPESCANGCDDNGACKRIFDCKNGYKDDGSCIKPEFCKLGWEDDGTCKKVNECKGNDGNLVEERNVDGTCAGCKNGWKEDGSCLCPESCAKGCKNDGSCEDKVCTDDACVECVYGIGKDGSCIKPEFCKLGWEDDGRCKDANECKDNDGNLVEERNVDGTCVGCKNGWNDDGSCLCPESCADKCDESGACVLADECKYGYNSDGSCACPSLCMNGCNMDGSCACSSLCADECNPDGSCKQAQGCVNGWNQDGSCACSDVCFLGCNNVGECKESEKCSCADEKYCEKDDEGKCKPCHEAWNTDGSCKECKNGWNKDGSCMCPNNCTDGCFGNGICKQLGACVGLNDVAVCNEYDYCKGNLCRCNAASYCVLRDSNLNNMDDLSELLERNETECEHDKADCKSKYGEGSFCDSFIGYKCSTKCKTDDQCLDGFICRSDGRCAADSFTTVWNKEFGGKTLRMGTSGDGYYIYVCWNWKEGGKTIADYPNIPEPDYNKYPELIGATCPNEFKHYECSNNCNEISLYPPESDSDITLKIYGKLDGVSFGPNRKNGTNDESDNKYLLEVQSFGNISLKKSAFVGCFNLTKLPSVDIPNSDKLNTMREMFYAACNLNYPIENWDVSNVEDISGLFDGCYFENNSKRAKFNQPLNKWNVSKVTEMSNVFLGADDFDQPLDEWDVSNVTDMHGMFAYTHFNKPIGNWKVNNVTNMASMFVNAVSFNQDLSDWKVGKVDNMQYMFYNAESFDQDLSSWDVSNVTDMSYMFCRASSFKHNLKSWGERVSNVKNMEGMFWGSYDPLNYFSLGDTGLEFWNLSKVSEDIKITNMLVNSGIHFQYIWGGSAKDSEFCKIYKRWKIHNIVFSKPGDDEIRLRPACHMLNDESCSTESEVMKCYNYNDICL